VANGQQVGSGSGLTTGNQQHALLWAGAAASSAIDLHPSFLGPLGGSFAYGIGDGKQIGYGYGPSTGNEQHALLWHGSADSAVDLNPAGYRESYAFGVSGGQEVGKANNTPIPGEYHAYVWSGTASSGVDLNPTGFSHSTAVGVGGGKQVGSGYGPISDDQFHALVWSGTAGSAVDLHSLLPASYSSSYAYSLDGSGNIYGLGIDGSDLHAIEWLLVKLRSDFNSDGTVDVTDLGRLASHWQQNATFINGDATGDGFVDVSDLGILAGEWQTSTGTLQSALAQVGLAGVSVPEPTTIAALAVPLCTCLLSRRRRRTSSVRAAACR
jgi:hypothetical protein